MSKEAIKRYFPRGTWEDILKELTAGREGNWEARGCRIQLEQPSISLGLDDPRGSIGVTVTLQEFLEGMHQEWVKTVFSADILKEVILLSRDYLPMREGESKE